MDIIEKLLEVVGTEWVLEIGFIQNGNLIYWSIFVIILGFIGFRTITKSHRKYMDNITEVEKEIFVMKFRTGVALGMLTVMFVIGLNILIGHNITFAIFISDNGFNQLFTTASIFGPPIVVYKKVTTLYSKAITREDKKKKEKLKKEKERQQKEKKNSKKILLL